MAETITVPKWDYHDKNIQGSIAQKDFTRADRVIIFTAPTPIPGAANETMKPIGLIQGMTHQEQKQLQMFFELGSDNAMIIPGLTQGQISLQRILLNGVNFINAIYHGVNLKELRDDQILRSIRDINVPFDLLIAKYAVNDKNASSTAVESTLFRGCQLSSRSESITAGGVVVMENVSLQYASIPKVTYKLS
jgi:hypothetical protein